MKKDFVIVFAKNRSKIPTKKKLCILSGKKSHESTFKKYFENTRVSMKKVSYAMS